MNKRILLTGVTGFLGSSLVRKLLEDGFEVVGLKRSYSNLSKIQSVVSHKSLRLFDLDKSGLEEVFSIARFDAIVHLATEYGRGEGSAHKVLETNLVFPIQLMELGIKFGVPHFINTDSYFNKENFKYSHLLNYSLSKRSLVQWLKNLSGKIRVSNMMLEHLYGPRDDMAKFVGSIVEKVAVIQVPHIALTHGHQKRDFIYVDDVADAYVLIIKRAESITAKYTEFQVGTGESIPIRIFVESVKALSNSSTRLGFGEVEYRSDEIMDSKADISALTELGWAAKVSLDEGLKRTLLSIQ